MYVCNITLYGIVNKVDVPFNQARSELLEGLWRNDYHCGPHGGPGIRGRFQTRQQTNYAIYIFIIYMRIYIV